MEAQTGLGGLLILVKPLFKDKEISKEVVTKNLKDFGIDNQETINFVFLVMKMEKRDEQKNI